VAARRPRLLAPVVAAFLAAVVVVVVVVVVGLVPSGGGTAADDRALTGTDWVLDQAASGVAPLVPAARVTARFASGSLTGRAGCNRYATRYRRSAATLRVDPAVATTRMACDEPTGRLEAAYLARLGAVRAVAVTGRVLTLRTGGAGPLVFRARGADGAPGEGR